MKEFITICKTLVNGVEVDDVLGAVDPVLSPASSCLYFPECMMEICPCYLIDATEIVPQIKKALIEGGDTSVKANS